MAKQLNITLALDIRPASEAVKSFVQIAQLGGTQVKAALAGQLPAPNLSAIDSELKQLDISLAEYVKRNLEAAQAVSTEATAEDQAGEARRRNIPPIETQANSLAELQERHARLSAQLRSADMGTDNFRRLSVEVARTEMQLRQAQEAQLTHARAAGISGMGTGDARQALIALNYTLRDSPYLLQNVSMGIMAISNNLPMLVDGFAMARQSSGSFSGTLKLLWGQMGGVMGVSLLFSLLMAGFQAYSFATMGAKDRTDELGDSVKKAKDELRELQEDLEKFNVSEQKAIEIDVKLRDSYKTELDQAKKDLAGLQNDAKFNTDAKTGGLIDPDLPNKISKLTARIAELETKISRSDALKKFQEMIFGIANAADASEGAVYEFARSNGVSEAMIQATISTLQESRKQLELESSAYQRNVQQVELLDRVLNRLRQTRKETFEEATDKSLAIAQASFQIGQTDANETIRQLQAVRTAIQENKDLTDAQRLQLLAQVDTQISSIRQQQIEAVSAIAQARVDAMDEGQEKELRAIQVKYQAERLRVQETYKDKTVAQQIIDSLNQQQVNEETEVYRKHARERQEIELQIAEMKAGLTVSESDREISLIRLQAQRKRDQIETEIKDEELKTQYLEALDAETQAKIHRVRMAFAMEYIQTFAQALGSAGAQFFTQLLQGGDSEDEVELRLLEFRKQEDQLRKDRSMSDEERELRLRVLARQRHEYEMRNATTLGGRIRNAFVGAAKSFGQALLDAVNRMIAELIAKEIVLNLLRITNSFMPSFFGASGGAGSPVNNPSAGLPMAANGGIVQKPTVLIAGEAGPEAIIPLNRLAALAPASTQQVVVSRVEVSGELRANGYEMRALISRVESLEKKFH